DSRIEIRDLCYVGSYSWTNSATPTIIVPGSPRQWLDRALPFKVKPDFGVVFVDQNAFRMKDKPLLPLIRAVELMGNTSPQLAVPSGVGGPERVDWGKVDFVTDRGNLRKLLRWINGTNAERVLRIDTQLAGDGTVLLNRWETRTREDGQGSYGFNLEKAATSPLAGCEEATSYHRIVKYDLGGLSMVVRFEVDAFIPPGQREKVDDESFLKAFSAPTVSGAPIPAKPGGLTIRHGGQMVPQSSLIELKSGRIKWPEVYPQLYVSQTPWLYKAAHENGQFHKVTKVGLVSPEMEEVAEKSNVKFERLRGALQTIKDIVVKAGPKGRLSFVLEGKELQVYDRESQSSCLTTDAMALF
ncbi:hypothetical protein FIBSPDRAFT_688699, partial [Athelia psychrophila]